MYNDIKSCLTINDSMSGFFHCGAGQGKTCPQYCFFFFQMIWSILLSHNTPSIRLFGYLFEQFFATLNRPSACNTMLQHINLHVIPQMLPKVPTFSTLKNPSPFRSIVKLMSTQFHGITAEESKLCSYPGTLIDNYQQYIKATFSSLLMYNSKQYTRKNILSIFKFKYLVYLPYKISSRPSLSIVYIFRRCFS